MCGLRVARRVLTAACCCSAAVMLGAALLTPTPLLPSAHRNCALAGSPEESLRFLARFAAPGGFLPLTYRLLSLPPPIPRPRAGWASGRSRRAKEKYFPTHPATSTPKSAPENQQAHPSADTRVPGRAAKGQGPAQRSCSCPVPLRRGAPSPPPGMPAWGRFPPGLRVPVHRPHRPSVLRLPRSLSRRGSVKPLGGQRRARYPPLGNLVGDPPPTPGR